MLPHMSLWNYNSKSKSDRISEQLDGSRCEGDREQNKEPLREIEWTQTSGKFVLEDPTADQLSAPEKDFVCTEYNNGSQTSSDSPKK